MRILVCLIAITGLGAAEIDDLVARLVPEPVHVGPADFAAAPVEVEQATADGTTTRTYWVVTDRGRPIAVYAPEMAQLDQVVFDPAAAPERLDWPSVYSWARLFGTRISTCAWLDHWGRGQEEHAFAFSGGGETLRLSVSEAWSERRVGASRYDLELRLDPHLGYVWDIAVDLAIDRLPSDKQGRPKPAIEFFNLQPQGVSSPWPEENRHDWCAFSAEGRDGYLGWANNLPAGDRSDRKPLGVREGGFFAFLPQREGDWGVALSHLDRGGLPTANSTCNYWLDQHHIIELPTTPDAEGRYAMRGRFAFHGLPPALAAEVRDRTELMFQGESMPMIRLGRVEDFEDQPLPLTTSERGLWTWGLQIDHERGRDSRRSLRVEGGAISGDSGRFIAPFIPLDAAATYRVSAWVLVEGEAQAFICHAPPTPEPGPMRHRSTDRIGDTAGEWKRIEWTCSGRGQLDLRIVCAGEGTAWFDDLEVVRVAPPARE